MLISLQNKTKKIKSEAGFSLIELIIVMLVISIISVMAVMSFKAEKKYSADDQASQIMDIFHEARHRSLTQRETMRVEINQTRNCIRLISENDPGTATDDQEIKAIKLQDPGHVVVGAIPENASKLPTEMSPAPELSFKQSVHPLSSSDKVATFRFVRTGKVLNAGSNAIGDNSVMTGATIYIWMPNYTDAGTPLPTGSIIRAITVQGTSGMPKYWKCPVIDTVCQNWVQ